MVEKWCKSIAHCKKQFSSGNHFRRGVSPRLIFPCVFLHLGCFIGKITPLKRYDMAAVRAVGIKLKNVSGVLI